MHLIFFRQFMQCVQFNHGNVYFRTLPTLNTPFNFFRRRLPVLDFSVLGSREASPVSCSSSYPRFSRAWEFPPLSSRSSLWYPRSSCGSLRVLEVPSCPSVASRSLVGSSVVGRCFVRFLSLFRTFSTFTAASTAAATSVSSRFVFFLTLQHLDQLFIRIYSI